MRQAVPALIERLHDEDPDVRRYAADALGRLEDERAVQPLVEALEDQDPWVTQWVAVALSRLGVSARDHGYRGELPEPDE